MAADSYEIIEYQNKVQMLELTSYEGYRSMDEEEVKRIVAACLSRNGWHVAIAKKRERGPDIRAHKGDRKQVIEAKGEATRPEMFNNYFVNALGEVIQRMNVNIAEYGIALPAHRKFLRLAHELQDLARQVIRLNFYFVQPHVGDEDYFIGFLGSNVR